MCDDCGHRPIIVMEQKVSLFGQLSFYLHWNFLVGITDKNEIKYTYGETVGLPTHCMSFVIHSELVGCSYQ